MPFVSVIHPTANAASTEISLPGDTQAFISTPIYARTNGYLKNWYADIGAHVKAGQLLAEIETPELDQQLQQAQSDLKNAQANLQISQATNKRYQGLIAAHCGLAARKPTPRRRTCTRSRRWSMRARPTFGGCCNCRTSRRSIAPFDGVITARDTDIGALIAPNDTRELFHLAAINKLRIYVSVPEVDAPLVHDGDKASLTVDSFPGETFTGTIVRNSDNIDPMTRTLNVEVDVDNPTGKLLPGAYVFVHFKFPATAGSVTVPSNTLLFRSEGPRVGVVRDGHAKLVPITIGHDYGTALEVLSGLSAQDNVIVDPVRFADRWHAGADRTRRQDAMKTTVARKHTGACLGRPREFDEDKVLLAAAHAFWQHGYHATSIDEICAATGLLRGSLYGAYGDKHGIFVAALNRYCESRMTRAAESLSGPPGREVLRRGLAYYFESAMDLSLARACFITNTALELVPQDREVARGHRAHVSPHVDVVVRGRDPRARRRRVQDQAREKGRRRLSRSASCRACACSAKFIAPTSWPMSSTSRCARWSKCAGLAGGNR